MMMDPHAVRPGTSAALTARTIDATIHPPLVRAQETVAALIPRVAVPLGSPVLISMLAGTLLLIWIATRVRFRPTAVLLSGLCVLTLTSFHPVRAGDIAQAADYPDNRPVRSTNDDWRLLQMPVMPDIDFGAVPEPEPQSYDDMTPAQIPDADDVEPPVETTPIAEPEVPATPDVYVTPTPPVSIRITAPLEISELERAQLEATIAELRIRLREEVRRQHRRRYY